MANEEQYIVVVNDKALPFHEIVGLAAQMLRGRVNEGGSITRIAPRSFGHPYLEQVMTRTAKWAEQLAALGKAITSQELANRLRRYVGESMHFLESYSDSDEFGKGKAFPKRGYHGDPGSQPPPPDKPGSDNWP